MAQQNNPFADAWRTFSEFKAPAVDFNGIFSIGRRNLETLTALNQALAEGCQAIARRSAEIIQENYQESLNLAREVYSSKSPDQSASKQAQYAKSSIENAMASAKEILDLASKTQVEAAEVLNKRISESMNEISGLVNKANASGSKKAA